MKAKFLPGKKVKKSGSTSKDEPQFHAARAAARTVIPQTISYTPVLAAAGGNTSSLAFTAVKKHSHTQNQTKRAKNLPLELMHRYSLGAFALLFLAVGAASVQTVEAYYTARINRNTNALQAVAASKLPARSITGFNVTVPAGELQSRLQAITSQPVTLAVGPYSENLPADTIKSWLQITANKDKSEYYVHTNQTALTASLNKEANEYVRTPVNQVTVTEDGASVLAAVGKNGRALSDPNGLKNQAEQLSKNVLDAKGLHFTTPLADVPFQAVTPTAFDKLLVANVTTKKMWAFEKGQQVNAFLTSDGAPATPTPIGQFHVYARLSVQDMSGYNPNGTKYFQPQVPWISYFYEGSAVHGVYWHPLSWFGNINSSHGCVGLPVDQAKWVYDWAPVGTTVITHA